MRPYHIKSNHFSRWIDLEAIQMISDVIENSIDHAPMNLTVFTITLAFQDKPVVVQSYKALAERVQGSMMPYACSEPATREEVLEERREIHALHDELVAAWLKLPRT